VFAKLGLANLQLSLRGDIHKKRGGYTGGAGGAGEGAERVAGGVARGIARGVARGDCGGEPRDFISDLNKGASNHP
jgi:hypothetical protein